MAIKAGKHPLLDDREGEIVPNETVFNYFLAI